MRHLRGKFKLDVRRRVYVQNMRHLRTNRMARRRLGDVYVAKRSMYSSFTGEARITRIHVNALKMRR